SSAGCWIVRAPGARASLFNYLEGAKHGEEKSQKRRQEKEEEESIRKEKEKGGKKEKGDESRHTPGHHDGTDGDCASSTVGRWNRRARRAESSRRVAFPDGIPAVGRAPAGRSRSRERLAWPLKLSGPAQVQSA